MSIAAMGDTDILVPKAILDRRRVVIREACLDYAALVDVLPTASSSADDVLASPLLDADPQACRTWLARVIRALPTHADREADHGPA